MRHGHRDWLGGPSSTEGWSVGVTRSGHMDDSWPAVARFAASGAKAGTCDFELSCNGQFLNEVFRCNLFSV